MFTCCFGCDVPIDWGDQLPPYLPNSRLNRIEFKTGNQKKRKINFNDKVYSIYIPEKVSVGID